MAAAPTSFSVTLHHLAPGAKAAGLGYPDEQLPAVPPAQLVEMLHALSTVAAGLTIYEPSSPEIRIKTDREVMVVRTRYRRLCFVGREAQLRGEDHSITLIMAVASGAAESEFAALPARTAERPSSAGPVSSRSYAAPSTGFLPDWVKLALLVVLSLGCVGTGVWMLMKPAKNFAPKFKLMSGDESRNLLGKVAGEYRTGIQPGDRRLIIDASGTMRLAKYGPAQAIAEEIVRTTRGITQNGTPGLATSDPYVVTVRGPDAVVFYGQTYKRVAP
ncbi:MAG: hypothetical protein WDM96_09760 [Lacunisphaera sp.]